MFDETVEKLLQEICTSLNKMANKNSYMEIFKKQENSIDFLMDGELKVITGISYYIDPRLTLSLFPLPIIINNIFIGIKLNVTLRVRMNDFTTGRNEIFQNYDYLSVVKYPFRGMDEKSWYAKIKQLNKEIEETKVRLQRLYTPSKILSKIVGDDPKPKYQILDLLSDYILKNNLRYQNGDIRIDGQLKKLFSKQTVCVSENVIFDALRENTLISEAQVYLSSLKGGILYAGKQTTGQTRFLQVHTGGKIFQYLNWPLN